MQEVKGGDVAELSTDINVITAEINAYKRIVGESIFEIGRRLKHVKEHDLAHGEFGKWLESVEIDRTLATRLMKIADELSDAKYATWHNLSQRVLYEIATLPEAERTTTHTTASGEQKTPDEMTVKELRELKRKLKQTEQERDAERKERERLEKESDKPPRIEFQTEYITPSDYEELRQENAELKSKYGVGFRKIDLRQKAELFSEFARDLEYIRTKYASVALDGHVLRDYVSSHEEVGEQIDSFDDFWNLFSKSVFKNQNIIEMESV